MLLVNEVFRSIQGEGIHTGREAVFIRLSGCNLNCYWCDTKYAFDLTKATQYTPEKLVVRALEEPACLYILTGGEPLIQDHAELVKLLGELHTYGEIAVETNGTIYPSGKLLEVVDFWSVSPKLGSSGNDPFTSDRLKRWVEIAGTGSIQFKFVVQNKEDLQEVASLIGGLGLRDDDLQDFLGQAFWVIQPEASTAQKIYTKLPNWTRKIIPELVPSVYYLPQIQRVMSIK